MAKFAVKDTERFGSRRLGLANWSSSDDSGTLGVRVESLDTNGDYLRAKATIDGATDTEVRRRGEQTGLANLVVRAVNHEC